MVSNNDLRRVNGGKGYGAVDRLDCSAVDWSVDCVYPGPGGGCAQHALLLALRLILIISQVAQYIVDGGSRFKWEVGVGRYSFDRRGGLRYADRLPDIPPEVADPNQFLYHKLQASTSVGLVPMVPMVVTPQRLVALCEIRLNGCRPFEFGMIPDERKELVIRDVQRGKLRRFPLSF